MATTKDFDCIAFKRAAQEKIYEQIQGMTPAEEMAWFRRKVEIGPYGELWRHIADKNRKSDVLHCAEDGEGYGG
jgi:hypothetical protein